MLVIFDNLSVRIESRDWNSTHFPLYNDASLATIQFFINKTGTRVCNSLGFEFKVWTQNDRSRAFRQGSIRTTNRKKLGFFFLGWSKIIFLNTTSSGAFGVSRFWLPPPDFLKRLTLSRTIFHPKRFWRRPPALLGLNFHGLATIPSPFLHLNMHWKV